MGLQGENYSHNAQPSVISATVADQLGNSCRVLLLNVLIGARTGISGADGAPMENGQMD